MTRILKGGMIALALAFQAHAGESVPRPQDFAYGFTVHSQSQGALWQLDLPEAVYRSTVQTDLGDMRVFNHAGQIIPHGLSLPEDMVGQAPEPVSVPLFPLHSQEEEIATGKMLRIITGARETVVETSQPADAADATDRVVAYLLDTRALEQPPVRLTLGWEKPPEKGFSASVAVESSDDLTHWIPLVKEAPLADLTSAMAALTHNAIELPARAANYLRITWPKALADVALTGVQASFEPAGKPPARQRLEVPATPDRAEIGVFDYDTGGHFPVETAAIEFAASNTLLRATIMSRPTLQAGWLTRHRGTFYRLEHAGTQLNSQPVNVGRTTDRYWRFRIEHQDWQVSGKPPQLVLGWRPHRLTLVAQGEPPYTVAFGNAGLTRATLPLNALMQGIDTQGQVLIVPAQASAVFPLSGKTRLDPPAPPFPWKTLTLWLVLLTGVAALAWMVHSLWRQMGPNSKNND